MEALVGRERVIGELARLVVRRARDARDHVLRVAVTGITASGKSTLAAELTEQIRSLGEPCVSLAVDGFHQPKAIRYRRGRESAEGYYRDAYNYDSLISRVLRPLGPGGDLSYVTRAFDLERDAPVEPALEKASPGSIAILDASFLLREEVRDWFDYRIFVHTELDRTLHDLCDRAAACPALSGRKIQAALEGAIGRRAGVIGATSWLRAVEAAR